MSVNRFIKAQEIYYNQAFYELKNDKKRTHWIWFIFPQIQGLGSSSMSIYYALKDLEETNEYWNNDYLRNNYLELCNILYASKVNNIRDILSDIDAIKLQSSLTLFAIISKEKLIINLLIKYYNGDMDGKTLSILKYKEENV